MQTNNTTASHDAATTYLHQPGRENAGASARDENLMDEDADDDASIDLDEETTDDSFLPDEDDILADDDIEEMEEEEDDDEDEVL